MSTCATRVFLTLPDELVPQLIQGKVICPFDCFIMRLLLSVWSHMELLPDGYKSLLNLPGRGIDPLYNTVFLPRYLFKFCPLAGPMVCRSVAISVLWEDPALGQILLCGMSFDLVEVDYPTFILYLVQKLPQFVPKGPQMSLTPIRLGVVPIIYYFGVGVYMYGTTADLCLVEEA